MSDLWIGPLKFGAKSKLMFRIHFFFIFTSFLFTGALSAQDPSEPMQGEFQDRVKGELYFRIHPDHSIELEEYRRSRDGKDAYPEKPWLASLLEPYRIQRIHCPFRTPAAQNIYKVAFEADNKAKTRQLVRELQGLEQVSYAEPVQRYRSFFQPNDISPEQSWYLDSIRAEGAWDISKGSADVKIAIVDDAVHISHPDLQGAIAENSDELPADGIDNDGNGYVDDVNGWDAADQDNDPEPPASHSWYGMGLSVFTHGTHTSGIAAGATDNGVGIAGMGFNSTIIPIKATSSGSIFPLGIGAPAEGIDYAISAGADIISMSFGGTLDCTVTQMLEIAHQDSIVLIASAGNNGATDTLWPAGMEEVIAIGSTTRGDQVSSFSQHGDWIDLMAPGDSIYSTYWEGSAGASSYAKLAGTSMSGPLVAGVASLMISTASSATPSDIRECLKEGCVNIDAENPGYIGQMGAGRLNAEAALNCIQSRYSSIGEAGSGNSVSFELYPNPAGSFLKYRCSENFRPVRAELLDLTGRSLSRYSLNGDRKGKLDLDLPKGLYLLRFRSEEGISRTRRISVR